MEHWTGGGGEQTIVVPVPVTVALPVPVPAKRYYADDLELLEEHDKRRRNKKKREDVADRLDRKLDDPNPNDIPECDIPYRSIEPRDTPARESQVHIDPEISVTQIEEPRKEPIFYILYEERFTGPLLPDRLRDDSHSPLPPRERDFDREREREDYPVIPVKPKHWANGAHLKTSDDDFYPYAYTPSPPAHGTPPPPQWARYQDWRERNCAYDMAADQEAEETRYSPFAKQDEYFNHKNTYDGGYLVAGHALSAAPTPPVPTPLAVNATPFISDAQAADNVDAHLTAFRRRCPNSRQERILRSLIHPKSGSGVADFELDDQALTNIMRTANDLFFGGRLRNRVQWDWSGADADPQYDGKIIGHTSLRIKKSKDSAGDGIETFVLLSTPILKNRAYSRRLLISAFLHELVHCYLFISCGWTARKDGGHTAGFRRIADTIDAWAGRDKLFLCHVEADLEQFRQEPLQEHGRHACRADYGHVYGQPLEPDQEHDWWAQHRRDAW